MDGKELLQEVAKLTLEGMTPEMVAAKLGLSLQLVQFIQGADSFRSIQQNG